jgi:three-Cys-motif partner protein
VPQVELLLQPSPRTGRSWPNVTFLDAFAGPGRYEAGEAGSPVLNLRGLLNHPLVDRMGLSRQRVQLVFVEKDRATYEFLLSELHDNFGDLDKLPVRVEVRYGEAGTASAS